MEANRALHASVAVSALRPVGLQTQKARRIVD